MYKFIYVFTKETADDLSAKGFAMVKADYKNNVYVFENKPRKEFNLSEETFVYSNTLTFG